MNFSFSSELVIQGSGPIYSAVPVIEKLFNHLQVLPTVEVEEADTLNFSVVMTAQGAARDFDELPLSPTATITGAYPCMAFLPCFDAADFMDNFLILLEAGFRLK